MGGAFWELLGLGAEEALVWSAFERVPLAVYRERAAQMEGGHLRYFLVAVIKYAHKSSVCSGFTVPEG